MLPRKKTDNRTRAQKIRAVQADAVRKKFKGNEYVRQLECVSGAYTSILNNLEKASIIKARLNKDELLRISVINAQIDILKLKLNTLQAQADLNFKRLKFVLPELRSIEITDPSGNNPFDTFLLSLKEAIQHDD